MAPASYAMTWHVGEGPRHAGRVELGRDALELSSTSPPDGQENVRFADIVGVALARGVLRVEREGLPPLRFLSIDSPGALRELADRISAASHARS